MSNLYLDEIFSHSSTNPSCVKIGIPVVDTGGNIKVTYLQGLLANEPTVVTSNKWGPILNDLSMLSFFASLAGMKSIPSWIGASVQCWKGTDPIRINLDFYLINYKRGLKLEKGLKALTKLTSLVLDRNSLTSVYVHGGYSTNILATNMSRFDNSVANGVKNGKLMTNAEIDQENRETADFFASTFRRLNDNLRTDATDGKGCVIVDIGNKMQVAGLLVGNVNVTPSIVEVYDRNTKIALPLYYHVTLALVGHRPLISDDVDKMYYRG